MIQKTICQLAIVFCLVCLSNQTSAQSSTRKQSKPVVTVLTNVNLVDVEKGEIVPGMSIVIEGDKIREIVGNYTPTQDDTVIDLTGRYAIPGLYDAHVHIANDPNETRADRVKHLEYYLKNGITSIRDMAGDIRILAELKRAVFVGEIKGPNIHYAAFIAGPGYYKDNDREGGSVVGLGTKYAPWLQCIAPEDNLDHAMVAAKATGATGIKIYAGFDKKQLEELGKCARKHDLKVWAHATQFPAIASECAESGAEVISHAYMLEWEAVGDGKLNDNIFDNYGPYYSLIDHSNIPMERFIAGMKKHNSIFDPTIYLSMQNQMEWSTELVKEMHESGVRICGGTDWINDINRDFPFIYDELEIYVDKCGLSPLDALRSVTIIAAETVGEESKKGSLVAGKDADIVILDKNPLVNINNLKSVKRVIRMGQEYKSER